MRTRLGFLGVALMLGLSACYMTREPGVAVGEDVGLRDGQYLCGPNTVVIEKKSPGAGDIVYAMTGLTTTGRADLTRFMRAKGDLFVWQVPANSDEPDVKYLIAFVRLSADRREFSAHGAAWDERRVAAVAASHKVGIVPKEQGAGLVGERANITAFLRAHDLSMMRANPNGETKALCKLQG